MIKAKPSIVNILKKGAPVIREAIVITMVIIEITLNQRGFFFIRLTKFLF